MTGLAELVGADPAQLTALLAALTERGETVAAAESLTGGLLTAVLTEVPGSSAVVRGSLVCYATDLKSTLVGVDPALLARVGAVHPEVASQLATGVRQRCGATIGIGLTGVAGPDPQDGTAVGTVYVALAGPGFVTVRGPGSDAGSDRSGTDRSGADHSGADRSGADRSGVDRSAVRYAAVRTALAMLADHVRLAGPN